MKISSPLNWKLQLAFGSAALSLLVVGAISYRGMAVSGESERWVGHTHEVLENLQDLVSTTENMEASCRGFVLTGDESYLESYRATVPRATQDGRTIGTLT